MFLISNVIQRWRKRKLSVCGNHCFVGRNSTIQGHVELGNYVSIGRGANLVSTHATIYVHDHVIFGPNVSIFSGNHPVDFVGKHISEIRDSDKTEKGKYDKDVVIEAGCWIGTGAIILKGVTIGRGSIIGAGAVVTKDVPPYSIYVGVPQKRVTPRFTVEQIREHERKLRERGVAIE